MILILSKTLLGIQTLGVLLFWSWKVGAQDIDPPPAPEAPKVLQKEEEVIGSSPALERYQECFQQMIDAGISDNQYMRECLDIEIKKPTPTPSMQLTEPEALSVVNANANIRPLEACYVGLLDRSKSLSLTPQGVINPSLKLGPKGEVVDVNFQSGQIVDLTFLECFKSKLKSLNFKKSAPETSVQIRYKLAVVGPKKSARVTLVKGFPKLLGPAYSLSEQDILAVFRRHVSKVRACYDDLLKTSPNISGKVAVELVVKGNGRVRRVVYKENSISDKKFKSCISTQFKSFVFPRTGTASDTVVRYPPLTFAPILPAQ